MLDKGRRSSLNLLIIGYMYSTLSRKMTFSSVRKHYWALGLGLGLAEMRFRSNVFSNKCSGPAL